MTDRTGSSPPPPTGGRASGKRLVAGLLVCMAIFIGASALIVLNSSLYQTRRSIPVRGDGAAESAPGADGRAAQPDDRTLAGIVKDAQNAAMQGEPGKAVAALQEAIARYPATQALYTTLGTILMGQRQPGEAYAQFEKALAVGPRTAELEFTAGTVAGLADRPERAVEHFAAAAAQEPGSGKIALHLGQAQMKAGQLDPARASLVRSLKLDEHQPIAWGMLAEISLRQNNGAMALQHIEKARRLEPGTLAWRIIEARAHRRENNPRAALETLAGLADAEKRQDAVLRLMAECYGMLGRPGDAAALYVAASDDQPEAADLAYEAALWLERAGEGARAADLARRAAGLGHEKARSLAEKLAAGG
jgi:predicted Zn-dependent protease